MFVKMKVTGKYRFVLKGCLHVSRLDASFAALRSFPPFLGLIAIGFQLFLFFPCFTSPSADISHLVFGSVGDNVEKSLNEVMREKSTTGSSSTDIWKDWTIFAARIHRFCDFTTSETIGNVLPWQLTGKQYLCSYSETLTVTCSDLLSASSALLHSH